MYTVRTGIHRNFLLDTRNGEDPMYCQNCADRSTLSFERGRIPFMIVLFQAIPYATAEAEPLDEGVF